MKRTLVQGLKFSAAFLLVYLTAFFALTHLHNLIYRTNDYYQWKGGVSYQKFKEWPESGRFDALVVGSSHAYRGYDPEVFGQRGYRMFNLGSSAQTPMSSYAVLYGYDTPVRARTVIIDLYENTFDVEGIESVSNLTQNMGSDAAALRLAFSFHDLRAVNMFTLRMMNKNGPGMFTDADYKGEGFAVKPDSAPANTDYSTGKPLRMNERQVEYFVKCLDLCAARGVQVMLCTHAYPGKSDHVRHAAFATFVDSVVATRPPKEKLCWLDFAYGHALDDHDHFFDHTHLNEAGARLFTAQLIDSLEAKGFLPKR